MIWDLVPKEYFCDTFHEILARNRPRHCRLHEACSTLFRHALKIRKGTSGVASTEISCLLALFLLSLFSSPAFASSHSPFSELSHYLLVLS